MVVFVKSMPLMRAWKVKLLEIVLRKVAVNV